MLPSLRVASSYHVDFYHSEIFDGAENEALVFFPLR